jgi:hypothetical protein
MRINLYVKSDSAKYSRAVLVKLPVVLRNMQGFDFGIEGENEYG